MVFGLEQVLYTPCRNNFRANNCCVGVLDKWGCQNQASSGPQDTRKLLECGVEVRHMLQHIETDDYVQTPTTECKMSHILELDGSVPAEMLLKIVLQLLHSDGICGELGAVRMPIAFL